MVEQGLKDKTIKGTVWSGIDQVVQYAVSFVVGIMYRKRVKLYSRFKSIVALMESYKHDLYAEPFAKLLDKRSDYI